MQFQKVNELVPGTKYKIISTFDTFDTFQGTFVRRMDFLQCFKNVSRYEMLSEVKIIPVFYTYYEPIFQRHRIQSEMEHRAINLLLQRITGDPTFTW